MQTIPGLLLKNCATYAIKIFNSTVTVSIHIMVQGLYRQLATADMFIIAINTTWEEKAKTSVIY